MYEIRYKKELISDDLSKLSIEARREALRYFKLFEKNYEKYSLPLYDMEGRNLRSCRKTYFWNAEYRIVSKMENGVVNIINIIAVGKRENIEVYKNAHQRLNKH